MKNNKKPVLERAFVKSVQIKVTFRDGPAGFAPYVVSCTPHCDPACQKKVGSFAKLSNCGGPCREFDIKTDAAALPKKTLPAQDMRIGEVFKCPMISKVHGEVVRRFNEMKEELPSASGIVLKADVNIDPAAANAKIDYIITCPGKLSKTWAEAAGKLRQHVSQGVYKAIYVATR